MKGRELVEGGPGVERLRRTESDDDPGIHVGHDRRAPGGVIRGGDLGHEEEGEHGYLLGAVGER